MRVKVRFRFNAVTGEIEAFEVDDMHDGPRVADHDARHDRAAADVARIVEANALIVELTPGTIPVAIEATQGTPGAETPVAHPRPARE
jgi:hypothetical protein